MDVRGRVMKVLAARDGKSFPRLEAKLWGEPIPRYEMSCVCWIICSLFGYLWIPMDTCGHL